MTPGHARRRPSPKPAIPLPDPPLGEGAVCLRPWSVADAAALVAGWSDPEVARWTGVPDRTEEVAARRWIEGEADRRARGLALDLVVDLDGAVVGEVGLSSLDPDAGTVEIGWWIDVAHRRRGLATVAARLMATWSVAELCVNTVLATCDPANPPSGGVARSAGFAPGGEDGVWTFRDGGGRGTVPP
ncbi:MAG: GNAT family N-acetyltransferase [Acidimicrobiales bacterium]|nr:GNAT family N-acetyltransferase [Acidimicrobiales bacterium]